MELLHEFGVEPILLVAQIVNFLIIMFILKRYAYKPILKALADRKRTIEQGFKQAEEARIALEKASAKEKELLKSAQTEAKKILTDARDQAQQLTKETAEQTKEQTAKMIAAAKAQIEQDSKAMEAKLASNVTVLAMHMLKTSLSGMLSGKEQEEIMQNALKKLKNKNIS